jgi:hypothetical protein
MAKRSYSRSQEEGRGKKEEGRRKKEEGKKKVREVGWVRRQQFPS